jgi:UDP-glucose 4-epimerase
VTSEGEGTGRLKVAVTGATGLIGSAVSAEIAARGHTVISLGRRDGCSVHADLADLDGLARLRLPACDALVHCAGVTDEEAKADPASTLRRAALGTDRLVAMAAAAGAERMVYVSSAHVYGPLSGHIDETSPANPLGDYALAHFLAEQIFRRNAGPRGLSVRLLRPCAVFGPLRALESFRRWSLIPFAFPRAIAETSVIRILGTGKDRRNFVGTDVVAAAAAEFIERPEPGVSVVNPIGIRDMTVAEFARLCAATGDGLLKRACRVEVAAPDGDAGPPLEYRSVDGSGRDGRALEAHVSELIRQCSQLGVHA